MLVKYCCPGYEGVDVNQCLPRCDMGCPLNSQCAIPNVCECNTGYEVDETYLYYGKKVPKSCRSKGFETLSLSIAASCLCLFVLLIIVALIVLIKCRQKRQIEYHDSSEKNQMQDIDSRPTEL